MTPFRKRTAERDGFMTPALGVSIAIALFAVVTQCLAATGAISLSTTQQLMMWLVAAGLVVLLWVAYMGQARLAQALRAATAAAERETATARAATQALAQAQQASEKRMAPAGAGRDDTVGSAESRPAEAESWAAWVPPDKLRRLDGPRQPVKMADVFPDGCYLDSISEARDYQEETDTGGEVVDINRPRSRMYRCVVVDVNRTLKDRPHDTVVDILTDQEPSIPPGVPHPFVEFDGLTITPYVTEHSPIRMWYALSATGVRLVAGQRQDAG